jgi:hypothetical protein
MRFTGENPPHIIIKLHCASTTDAPGGESLPNKLGPLIVGCRLIL